MEKINTRHRRQRITRRKTRKMRGGTLSQIELQQLQNNGFNEDQIQTLQQMNISFNEVMQKVNTIMNQGDTGFHGNSDNLTEQVMFELLNEHIENTNANDMIPPSDDDIHDIDLSFDDSQGSLYLSDLNVTNDSMDANTTIPDETFNESQMSDISENPNYTSETGGKKRRRKTTRKTKKGRKSKQKGKKQKGKKSRKQKGGMCYGNGVGANSYNPNFSIYNTRELELFPYRPK